VGGPNSVRKHRVCRYYCHRRCSNTTHCQLPQTSRTVGSDRDVCDAVLKIVIIHLSPVAVHVCMRSNLQGVHCARPPSCKLSYDI